MLIQVTQADIDVGKAGDCEHCPIALALYRATGRAWFVAGRVVELVGKGRVYILPPECGRFVARFDDGREVTPFAFELQFEEVGQ